jgi:hypothetical protein
MLPITNRQYGVRLTLIRKLREQPFVTFYEPACGAGARTANALTDAPSRRILHTPMYYLGNWRSRLNHIPHLTESLPL